VTALLSQFRLVSRRTLVWLGVLSAIGVGIWRVPGTFRSAQQAVDAVHGLTPTERSLLPARSFDISTELFVAAAQDVLRRDRQRDRRLEPVRPPEDTDIRRVLAPSAPDDE
jgi:hypothetical protein